MGEFSFIDIEPLCKLKDVPITGNFSINCETHDQYIMLQNFFHTNNQSIAFSKINQVKNQKSITKESDSSRLKFVIKYESFEELLRLRDIFMVRANKFDMYLIKKRKNGIVFDEEMLKKFSTLEISKARR